MLAANKGKMRRSTGIYIFILLILVGLYYFLNNRDPKAEEEVAFSTPIPVEYLFNIEDGPLTQIRVESKTGEIVEIARNEENAWVIKLPIETEADQGTVEAAAGQIATVRILDRIPDLSKEAVGLDEPEFSFTIQFGSNVERIINIGVPTPTGSGYYANSGDNEILILSSSGLEPFIGFVTNPPYLETGTSVLPTPEADSTP